MKFSGWFLAIFLICMLLGCGGGGGGKSSAPTSQPDSNSAPTVSISGSIDIEANSNVSLTANAVDSDGTIVSYAWAVDAGSGITLTDTTKAQVSFVAPVVSKDSSISLSVTVTDNKGATARATKQITVKSQKTSLTITGLVIDGGAIPNADLTFAVGDLTYKAKADVAGKYTTALAIDNAHSDIPLVITAVGDATKPNVKLASQLASINSLIAQAGTDKILDATENIGVNISNVTTAEFALLTSPSSLGTVNDPIITDTQLQQALESVGSYEKIRRATFLQIIASNAEFKLPDGYKTTLDFLQDSAAVNEFEIMLNQKNPTLAEQVKSSINQNTNLIKTKSDLIGKYIVYSQANPALSSYITLNSDLSGELISTQFKSAFQWVKQGSTVTLNFVKPIETGETDFWGGHWVIKAADLYVYDEYPSVRYANFALRKMLIEKDGQETLPDYKQTNAKLFDLSKKIISDEKSLVGEWVVGKTYDVANFQLNADHSAITKTYKYPVETTSPTWSFDTNKLTLNTNNTLTNDIYFTSDLGVGYSYIKVTSESNKVTGFSDGLFIKPQNNLALKKSDFIGRWIDSGSSSMRVMANDGLMFTDFGAWSMIWSNNEANNSWERNAYYQNYNEYLTSCEASAGTNTGCELYKNNTYNVIAVNRNTYYSLRAETTYKGTPVIFYSLEQSVKLPEIKYFSKWMLSGNQNTFYQKTPNGINVWNFYQNKILVTNKVVSLNDFYNSATVFSLKHNKLHYTRDNIARELQLISASENGLTVCEFNEGTSCSAGTEFVLSNRTPAKVSLKVIGSGSIIGAQGSDATLIPDFLFGNKAVYNIIPDAGNIIKSVTGCDGDMNMNVGFRLYVTSEVRDACTITATFEMAQ